MVNNLFLDIEIQSKIKRDQVEHLFGSWVTKIGNHQLAEIIVGYYTGIKYILPPFSGSDYRFSQLTKNISLNRTNIPPSQMLNSKIKWNSQIYWFEDSSGDIIMLDEAQS